MVSLKHPKITVARFEKAFASRTEAAEALGVTRQSLYNWSNADGMVPELMSWKAQAILDRVRAQKASVGSQSG